MNSDIAMLRQRLRATIDAGAIEAAFQPIVDLKRAEIAGFETLARPTSGGDFKGPSELFDAAERTGLLWDLETVTRGTSLQAASEWPAEAKLFLNTTPEVFADPRFCGAVLESVRATPGLTPSRVVLEITERSEQQHVQGLEEQVRLVKASGFEIAIDDVGAGTSGLNRIMALRPHWLKLDRELVEGIHQDRVRQNLIRFLVRFATLSGVRMIAEGIEKQEELATLMDLGVVFGQGYLLGRPGSRQQTLRADIRDFIRNARLGGPMGLQPDRRGDTVAPFVRPVLTIDSRRRVGEVAAELLRDSEVSGFVVVEGTQPVGWCDRDSLLRAAADNRSGQLIGFVVSPGLACAGPDASIPDVLDLACSRDERNAGTPIVITGERGVLGTLSVTDLLFAASKLARNVQLRIAPLTGLPGRVRADEHLLSLLSPAPSRPDQPRLGTGPSDIAIVDIESFAQYNEQMGYELGDELLRRTVQGLQALAEEQQARIFLAHLGDDRFLVTAPSPTLRSLAHQFAERFDEREKAWASTLSTNAALVPRCRVVLFEAGTRTLRSAQSLYRLAEQLHRGARTGAGASRVVDAAAIVPATTLRASA